MRPGISIALKPTDRRRLESILGNRKAPQKHVWRAEIVLLSAAGFGTVAIMRRTGKFQDLRLALAGTLFGGRGRRPPARQDQAIAAGAAQGH